MIRTHYATVITLGAMSLLFVGAVLAVSGDTPKTDGGPQSVYDFTVKNIDGKDVALSKYKGDVLLVVNTASKCGYTPQYTGLEALYKKYKDQGFKVLAFPANNFGAQEPGSNADIKKFCSNDYPITFDLFSKISVMGDDQAPLYKYLTAHPNKDIAGDVKWNFQKYLVGRDGTVLAKFGTKTTPDDKDLVSQVEKALAASKSGSANPPGK